MARQAWGSSSEAYGPHGRAKAKRWFVSERAMKRTRWKCTVLAVLVVPVVLWKLVVYRSGSGSHNADEYEPLSGEISIDAEARRLAAFADSLPPIETGYDCLSVDEYQDRKSVKLRMVRKYHVTMGGEEGDAPSTPATARSRSKSSRRTTSKVETASNHSDGFLKKLEQAESIIQKENILNPDEAKKYLAMHPDCLFLDVQENHTNSVPGTYHCPLGELFFKASRDLPEYRDPTLADRPKDAPILVTCGLGGQAKIAGKMLKDYGFTEVKCVEGGCFAWKQSSRPTLPVGWPQSLECNTREEARVSDVEMSELFTRGRISSPRRPSLMRIRSSQVGAAPSFLQRHQQSADGIHSSNTHPTAGHHPPSASKVGQTWPICRRVSALVNDLFVAPYSLAWEPPFAGQLLVTYILSMLAWTLDIALNFCTGFYQAGQVRLEARAIVSRYVRSWFLFDAVLVAIGWARLGAEMVADPSTSFLTLLQMLRVLSATNMLRVFRFRAAFERIVDRSYSSITITRSIHVSQILLTIVLVIHFIGCSWYAVGKYADSNTGSRWIDREMDGMATTFKDADRMYQYSTSIHVAMSNVFSGEQVVPATNTVERWFSITCLAFGAVFFSSLLSAVLAEVSKMQMRAQEHSNKLAQLRHFCCIKKLTPELKVNVTKQVDDYMAATKPVVAEELLVWPLIGDRLRAQIVQEIHTPLLCRHPFILLASHIEPECVSRLCSHATKINVLSAKESLFKVGARAAEAFYVISGGLKYVQEPSTSFVHAEVTTAVDKDTWFCEPALWLNWTHVGNMDSRKATELLSLHGKEMARVFAQQPQLSRVANEYSRAYHACVVSAGHPCTTWPNDLHVPLADHDQVLCSLSPVGRVFISNILIDQALEWSPWGVFTDFAHVRDLVSSEKCCLAPSVGGGMQSLQAFVSVELARADGAVLVQLGTSTHERVTAACELPTVELLECESPLEAVQRLMFGPLGLSDDQVELSNCEIDCKTRNVAVGIVRAKTTYVRYRAAALRPLDGPSFIRTGGHCYGEEIICFASDVQPDVFPLCAWMQSEAFERLCREEGHLELESILSTVRMTAELEQQARAIQGLSETSSNVDPEGLESAESLISEKARASGKSRHSLPSLSRALPRRTRVSSEPTVSKYCTDSEENSSPKMIAAPSEYVLACGRAHAQHEEDPNSHRDASASSHSATQSTQLTCAFHGVVTCDP